MDFQKDYATVTQAAQKIQYAKELLAEAVSQICQIQKPKSQIATEPLLVAIHSSSTLQDDIFVLAFAASKMLKTDWEFMQSTLDRIQGELHEKSQGSNRDLTQTMAVDDSKKSISIVGPYQETPQV